MRAPIRRVEPGPGQESAWDYPRPPALVASERHVVVKRAGEVVADTRRAQRVLETSHPPTWYVHPDDVVPGLLTRSETSSTWCEWKGPATYWDLAELTAVAWSYEDPTPGFVDLAGWFAFSPSRLECFVDDERVVPQEGGFYAGWITSDVVGPFKGGPGTLGW